MDGGEGENGPAWEVINAAHYDGGSRLRRGWGEIALFCQRKWKQLGVYAVRASQSNMLVIHFFSPFFLDASVYVCMCAWERWDTAGEECSHGCKVGVKTAMLSDLRVDLPTPPSLVADNVLPLCVCVLQKKGLKKSVYVITFFQDCLVLMSVCGCRVSVLPVCMCALIDVSEWSLVYTSPREQVKRIILKY